MLKKTITAKLRTESLLDDEELKLASQEKAKILEAFDKMSSEKNEDRAEDKLENNEEEANDSEDQSDQSN